MERKIICRNVGVCTKAGKVQIITDDDAELKCPECGSEDVELVKDVPTNPGNTKKIIAIIAAAIIVLGGGGFGIFKACSSGDKTEPEKPGTDTVQVDTLKNDTVKVDTAKVDKPEVKPEEETKKEPEKVEPMPTTNTVFGGRAKYDKAAGVITFTGTVTISLHDEDDNTLTFRRGDKIRSAKVSGGRLVGGEAVIGGESQLLSGISERL